MGSPFLIQLLFYSTKTYSVYRPGSCHRSRTQATRHDRFRGSHPGSRDWSQNLNHTPYLAAID